MNTSIDLKSKISNSKFKSFIKSDGILTTIKRLDSEYGDEMNNNIPDTSVRLMVWQFTHSLKNLEKLIKSDITDIDQLMGISKYYNRSQDVNQNDIRYVIANQLLNSIDCIQEYIDL